MVEGVFAGFLGLVCLIFAALIVVLIFYLLTLQKALGRVSARNRLMEPGLVWLLLIPLFNIVWNFFIVTRVPDSLRNEFRDRDRDDGSDYGKTIGLPNAILVAITASVNVLHLLSHSPAVRLILLPVGLANLVLFILFWVKIAGYSAQLASRPRYAEDGGDDFDDYDDRPRSRRRRRRDDFEADEDFEAERPARRRRRNEDDEFRSDEPPPRTSPMKAANLPPPAPMPSPDGALVVKCSACQKDLKVPANVMGKKVKCPLCGAAFVAE
jgi:hypothetical protein